MNYHHLTREQRYQIAVCLKMKKSLTQIAGFLGVHKSTLSRELERNMGGRGYRPKQAHNLALERRQRCRKPLKIVAALAKTVTTLIQQYWSPEQISGRLKAEKSITLSNECIYSFIKRDKDNGGRLFKFLRHSNRKRRKRFAIDRRGQIQNRTSIEERPDYINNKEEVGHWERDTVMGKGHKAGVAVHVERKTYMVKLTRLFRKTAANFSRVTIRLLGAQQIPCESITNDNGQEFAGHQKTARKLGATIYFSHPYTSCDCAIVENTNGLIRQFFPKGTDFRKVSHYKVRKAEESLNMRPRKALGYLTPFEFSHGITVQLT